MGRGFLALWLGSLSPGAKVIGILAVASSIAVLVLTGSGSKGERAFWTFSIEHATMYEGIVDDWNDRHDPDIDLTVLEMVGFEQRMLGGFLSGVPTADVLEVERRIAFRAFSGPLESVGFADLTDRLREEGIYDRINAASFSPWTSRGRIFGLPHDVHPVLLSYRADIVEAAGIDVNEIETWADFKRVMRPLMDGGDRFLISFWETEIDWIELIFAQAGPGFFDENDRLAMVTDTNVNVLAELVTWMTGPNRIAAHVKEFSAGGDQLRLDGYVVSAFTPDWLCFVRKAQQPQLHGKLKIMPLPAWEPGGRRTSVWGGTMLGIPKTAPDFESSWEFAKHLYLSDKLARQLYTSNDIITPIKEHWDDPIFDEPDPYFCGQPKGRLYIEYAPQVPRRTSSTYNSAALLAVRDALIDLRKYAERKEIYDVPSLLPEARRLLEAAEENVRREMSRNLFLDEDA